MAYILLCIQHKSGENICYNSRDIEFFLGDCFFIDAPVCIDVITLCEMWFHEGMASFKIIIIIMVRTIEVAVVFRTGYAVWHFCSDAVFWCQIFCTLLVSTRN